MSASIFNRREFMERTSLAAAALALTPLSDRAAEPPSHADQNPRRASASPDEAREAGQPQARWKVIAFSKPFTNLSFDDTADLVADVGWDGIECPVRKSATHILPERVEEDLPKMVDALRKRGREVAMITTDITGVDRTAEQILRTAAKAGIRRYRLGPIRYTADRSIPDQLKDIKVRIRDLAQLNKTVGIQGGIQNHSGQDYFAAPVWDAFEVIQGLDPADIGISFDIGHATLEGGLSWPLQARLAEPRYSVVYVKDFRWEKREKGWSPVWCPLGQGMVNTRFFTMLARSRFNGPVCQHHEYEIGKTSAEMVPHFKRDLRILREWLKEAA